MYSRSKIFCSRHFVLTFAFSVLYVASLLLEMFVLSAEDLKKFNLQYTIMYTCKFLTFNKTI